MDVCIIYEEIISNVTHFCVNQDSTFPSNHAPVTVEFHFPETHMNTDQLLSRTEDLGTYYHPSKQNLCKNAIPYKRINIELFTQKLE